MMAPCPTQRYPYLEIFNLSQSQPAITASECQVSLVARREIPLSKDENLSQLFEALCLYHQSLSQSFKIRTPVYITSVSIRITTHIVTGPGVPPPPRTRSAGHAKPHQPTPPQPSEYDAIYTLVHTILHSTVMCGLVEKFLNSSGQPKGKEVDSLRELKHSLIAYSSALDSVLQLYTFNSDHQKMTNDMLKEVFQAMSEVQKIIQKMNPKNLGELIPDAEDVSPDHMLCSVIGIEPQCADWLQSMDEEMRGHEEDQYWFQRYIEDKEEQMEEDDEEDEEDAENMDVEEKLRKLGFTSHRARCLAEWLSKDTTPLDHQTVLYSACRYIEEAFEYDILLKDVPRYPYQKARGSWTSVEVENREEEDDAPQASNIPRTVDVINLDGTGDLSYGVKNEADFPPVSDADFLVLSHGTDHNSARSLIEQGIILGRGNEKQDFSGYRKSGFYLNEDFDAARRWAVGRTPSHSAVVVYKVPRDKLASLVTTKLDLRSNRDEWEEIVRYNRTQGEHQLTRDLLGRYRRASCVEGPVCRRGIPSNPQPSHDQQLCVLSEDLARVLGDLGHICGVLFF